MNMRYTYDALGRLVAAVYDGDQGGQQIGGQEIAISYDGVGNPVTVVVKGPALPVQAQTPGPALPVQAQTPGPALPVQTPGPAPVRAAPGIPQPAAPAQRPPSAPTQVAPMPQLTPQPPAPARARVGRLTVRSGALAPREFLIGEALELGREPDNDAMLPDPKVSRHHARIRRDGERYELADLGSSNGTFVNGERIAAPARLEDGDVILIGDVELIFSQRD